MEYCMQGDCEKREHRKGMIIGNACAANSLSLSLRFNGHFPGEPGLAGV